MKAYRIEKKIDANGVLTIQGLPFQEGEEVEVIVLSNKPKKNVNPSTSLRGKVLEYKNPTEPVGQDDWAVTQ